MAEEQSASPTKRASWRGYVQLLPDTGLAGPKPPKSPEDPQSPDQSPISRRRRSLKKAKTVRDLEKEASKERALSMHREEAGPPETIPADDWEKWVGKAGDVIFPNEQWKLIWDFVLLTFIMYSCVVVPFRLGMNHAAEGEWWNFEVAITVFFITDLVLTFRVAVAEGDELIIDKASIRRVYMQFWFWVDASSSFPVEVFELAAKLADADGSGGNHHNRWQLSMLKLLRGLRLLRLLRLLKVFKLKIYMQIIEERLRFNMQYLQLLKMVSMILYLMHLFGCGWFFLHLSVYQRESGLGKSDEEIQTWLTAYDPEYGLHGSVWVQYVDSIYWALMTLTTVGYGDITPQNDLERLYTLSCLLVGAVVFGFLLSTLGDLISNVDPAAVRIDEKLRDVKEYLRWHGVPLDLALSVRRYYEYYFTRRSPVDEETLLDQLTPSLRRDVLTHLLNKTVARIPLFSSEHLSYVTLDFQLAVYPMLKPLVREAKEVVLEKRSMDGDIYFLSRGAVIASGDIKLSFFELDAQGACFGEQALMNEPSSFTYSAKIRSELFSLSRSDFAALVGKFPPSGKEEIVEALLEEYFKHSISRNVAIGLYANGIAVKTQRSGQKGDRMELTERMALRMQRGYYVTVLSRLSGVDSPPLDVVMPTLFGKPLISRREQRNKELGVTGTVTSLDSTDEPVKLIRPTSSDATTRMRMEGMEALASRWRAMRADSMRARAMRPAATGAHEVPPPAEAASGLAAATATDLGASAMAAVSAKGASPGGQQAEGAPAANGEVATPTAGMNGGAASAAESAAMVRVERSLDAAMGRVEMLMERIVQRMDAQEAKLSALERKLTAMPVEARPTSVRVGSPLVGGSGGGGSPGAQASYGVRF